MSLYHALPLSPGLNHSDSITKMMGKIFHYYLLRCKTFEQDTRNENDIEALHGLRVTIRYLKVITTIFKDYLPSDVYKEIKKILKKGGESTGKLRDLDVFIEKYMGDSDTGLVLDQKFQEYILGRHRQMRQDLVKYLDSVDCQKLMHYLAEISMGKMVMLPEGNDQNSYGFIRNAILKRLNKVNRFNDVLEWGDYHGLHRERLKIKRLRYAIEIFTDLMADQGESLLTILKDLQDKLGFFCDSTMAENILGEYVADVGSGDQVAGHLIDEVTGAARENLLMDVKNSWEEYIQMDFEGALDKTLAPLAG